MEPNYSWIYLLIFLIIPLARIIPRLLRKKGLSPNMPTTGENPRRNFFQENSPDEIFEFSDLWKGNIPLIVVPTSYGSVTNDELIAHKIKIVIFANQTLRIAHSSMSRLLKKLNAAQSLDEVDEEMSSMEEIFNLQKMFELNSQEKDIEEKLKKLGYIS